MLSEPERGWDRLAPDPRATPLLLRDLSLDLLDELGTTYHGINEMSSGVGGSSSVDAASSEATQRASGERGSSSVGPDAEMGPGSAAAEAEHKEQRKLERLREKGRRAQARYRARRKEAAQCRVKEHERLSHEIAIARMEHTALHGRAEALERMLVFKEGCATLLDRAAAELAGGRGLGGVCHPLEGDLSAYGWSPPTYAQYGAAQIPTPGPVLEKEPWRAFSGTSSPGPVAPAPGINGASAVPQTPVFRVEPCTGMPGTGSMFRVRFDELPGLSDGQRAKIDNLLHSIRTGTSPLRPTIDEAVVNGTRAELSAAWRELVVETAARIPGSVSTLSPHYAASRELITRICNFLYTIVESRSEEVAHVLQPDEAGAATALADPRHWRAVSRGLELDAGQAAELRTIAAAANSARAGILARRRHLLGQVIARAGDGDDTALSAAARRSVALLELVKGLRDSVVEERLLWMNLSMRCYSIMTETQRVRMTLLSYPCFPDVQRLLEHVESQFDLELNIDQNTAHWVLADRKPYEPC